MSSVGSCIRACWLRLRWLTCAILPAALLSAVCAKATQIGVQCGKGCAINISGHIEDGDDRAFHELAAAQPNALVVLSGPGGKVVPALAMGMEIRARGLRTLILPGASCASACSFIWLGGTVRLLGKDARVGFHAMSAAHPGGTPAETHAFDTALIQYLTTLGYAYDVTATIVNTPSVLVHWRDAIELNANGIATQNYP